MKLFLGNLLFLLAASTTTWAASCDKSLLPDFTFYLSGRNLDWPCQSTKNIYESSGRYIPRNMIMTKFQVYKDEVILAIPRYRPGIPFTLGVMSLKSTVCSPAITPFPCWSIQEEGNENALQSVVDLVLDVQDILWVLDVGITNTLDRAPVRRAPPKVVGIDVKTGKVNLSLHQ